MKHKVECEDCGKGFEENGLYDLGKAIIEHFEGGDCEYQQEENRRIQNEK